MSFIYILFLKYSKPTVKIILKLSMSIAHGEAPSPGADYSFLCLSTLSKSSIIAIVFATKPVRPTIAISLIESMLRIYSCRVTFVARSTKSKYNFIRLKQCIVKHLHILLLSDF